MPVVLLVIALIVASLTRTIADWIGVPWANALTGLMYSAPVVGLWIVFVIWAVRASWHVIAMGTALAIMLFWKVWAPIIISAHTSEFLQSARTQGYDIPVTSIYETWEFAYSGDIVAAVIMAWTAWSIFTER